MSALDDIAAERQRQITMARAWSALLKEAS